MKQIFQAIAVVSAIAISPVTVRAASLLPGNTVVVPATVENGTLLGFESMPFTFGAANSANRIVGNFNEAVYQQLDGNLDFAYQVNITGTGTTGNVASFSIADATNVATGVGSTNALLPFPLGNVAITTASRSVDGSTLSFAPTTPLTAGLTSFVTLIQTDATQFDQNGSATFVNSSGSRGG